MKTDKTAALKNVSFGSSHDRELFPYHCAPDRLGNEMAPIRGEPHCGPGSYRNEEVTNMIYLMSKKPESTRGYALGARTAPQYPLEKTIQSPGPAAYQSYWSKERVFTPAYAPFSISADRFSSKVPEAERRPGPGVYELGVPCSKRVTWPMKFGSPDWSQVPSLEKRTLRSELITDKEFRKHRNRVSYLSLYYS
ncbi:ciliary microtubule-associated protein 3 isoform X2 [Ambystoma mexicanum]|uniref:ciliary microtubule-associated protein 3 isoform X2 n=1 Tax=Ambystoma mexicanum TaxID=8296 RepID=UPI0037E837CE